MSATYQIGRDVQDLYARLQVLEDKLDSQNKEGKEPCPAPTTDYFKITEQGEVKTATGEILAYKTATFIGDKLADCEWKKESITFYSNGDYRDIYELKDHGTVFGDNFATQIKLQNSSGHTYAEWKWDVKVRAGADWSDTVKGHSNAIKESFNDITNIARHRVCSW